jgi:hypothetical protein
MVAKLLQMFRLSLFLLRITKTSLKPTRVSAVMAMTPAVWRPGKRATLEGLFSNVCVATAQPGRWLRTCCIASWRIIWDKGVYIYMVPPQERVVSGEALDAKTHLDGLQRRAPHRCVLKWHKVVMRCKIFKVPSV